MTFPQTTATNTPEPYKFQLTSQLNGQTIVCDPAPLEWASGTLEMNRDLSIGGVFSTFHLDSLTFVGNGATMLNDLFNAYELNASCTLIVYWWKWSTRSYVEFPSRFDINFNFYERVKIGKFVFGVRVKAINSSIQTKLDNRSDIDVDLTKLISIGGVALADYSPLKKGLNYDATNVFNYAQYTQSGRWDLPRKPGVISYTSCPLLISQSDFTEAQSVAYITQSQFLYPIQSLLRSAKFDYTFSVKYRFGIIVESDNVNDQWEIHLMETERLTDITADVVFNDNDIILGSFGSSPGYFTFEDTVDFSISAGHDIKLVIRVANTQRLKAYLTYSFISLTQTIVQSPAKLTEGFPIYEAMERTCQHILDTQLPIYSEFFGRTDTPYSAVGTCYASENQLRFAHIQSGLNQRGILLNDPDYSLAVNFKDLESSARKIYNTGYSFEMIEGQLRLRIEEYAFFFQDTLVLDISDRIGKYDIQSQVMPELVPVDLKSGFESYEYLQINGRSEPNTTNQRTSIMNTSAKFDNVSKLRGDTKGILDNLSNPIDLTGTTDTKGDNDIFIVKTQRDETYDWKPEKAENVSIDNDTSIFKEDLLNRLYTPSRMLKRHGNRIKSGMMKFTSSVLRFQKSDKLQTLETTGESYSIAENSDITVSDLGSPIYKPMKHRVECSFNFADLSAIQANPFGYIKLSDTVSGYLLSLKKKNDEAMAEITIIEKY